MFKVATGPHTDHIIHAHDELAPA